MGNNEKNELRKYSKPTYKRPSSQMCNLLNRIDVQKKSRANNNNTSNFSISASCILKRENSQYLKTSNSINNSMKPPIRRVSLQQKYNQNKFRLKPSLRLSVERLSANRHVNDEQNKISQKRNKNRSQLTFNDQNHSIQYHQPLR